MMLTICLGIVSNDKISDQKKKLQEERSVVNGQEEETEGPLVIAES